MKFLYEDNLLDKFKKNPRTLAKREAPSYLKFLIEKLLKIPSKNIKTSVLLIANIG
jgi:hypothetical protein